MKKIKNLLLLGISGIMIFSLIFPIFATIEETKEGITTISVKQCLPSESVVKAIKEIF